MIITAVMCLIPANNFNEFERFPIPHKDKIVHFTFYFVFVLLWNYTFKGRQNIKARFFIFIVAVFYGVIIELCQKLFTVTRSPDFTDALVNTCGALLGTILFWLLNKNK
ncbi:VanZ family protein [Flavobacterium sp.]|uniref:VanZ family protein n=1 Tax=Flavobacterium sp. TaxID=239 RepID=UPI003A8D6402